MKGLSWIRSMVLAVLSASAPLVSAVGVAPASGTYENLMIAVTPDQNVEGYFVETLGEGVTRRCAFYFQGKVDDTAPVQITTWQRQALPGSIEVTADGIVLSVPRGQEHPGCSSVLGPMISTGLALSRTASKNWVGLATVSAEKAYLQRKAGAQRSTGPYIIKGDVVGVLANQPDWAHVEFTGEDGRSHLGWIRQDQLDHPQPPE